MQQANDLLYGILQVVGRIEQNMKGGGGAQPGTPAAGEPKSKLSVLSNLGAALSSFKNVTPKSIKTFFSFMDQMLDVANKSKKSSEFKDLSVTMMNLGQALPGIAAGMEVLGKTRGRNLDMALASLHHLFQFVEDLGKPSAAKKVKSGTESIEKLGKALRGFNVIKDIGLGFMYLGAGILAFVGSIVLSALLMKMGKPSDILIFLGITIIGMVVMFGALYLASKFVKGGVKVVKDMGLGLAALSLGIIAFALTIRLLPLIFKDESGGSIAKGMLILIGIIGVMALAFMALDLAKPFVDGGFKTILLMSAGLAIFAITVLGLAMVAKMLMSGMTFDKNAEKAEKDENRKSMIRGLGMFGLILVGAIAAFALLGIPGFSTIIKSGAITMMLMGAALYIMSIAIEKLVTVGERLAGSDIGTTLTHLIGGTIDGFLGGLASLSGGKKGIAGVAEFIKNSAKIFAGIGVLMAMSLALSMFAQAITAFAELENIRIIDHYDKDGKPVFGEKVNLMKVADNLTYSISTFLSSLIASTEDLTKKKAGAIKKMDNALTGKRGILTAVIQFANAMKVYAEFGENNEIGYVDYDAKGNEIHKKVKADVVVQNMIGSFLYFTEQLFNKSDTEFGDGEEAGISGRQRRRMKRMSKALVGKNGILGAVIAFAETLKMFAEFGPDNEMPILGEDGKPVMENGKPKVLQINQIASNIVKALMSFSDTLAVGLENAKPKDAKKAVEKFSGIIEELSKFSESLSALEKVNETISNLAKSINDLSVSLDNFDTAKLKKLSYIPGVSVSTSPETGASGAKENVAAVTEKVSIAAKGNEVSKDNWDNIAGIIGQHVGSSLVEAMKSGQIKFEFAPSGGGKGVLTFD